MSNISGDDGSFSSGNTGEEVQQQQKQQQQLQAGSGSGSGSAGPSAASNSNGSTSQQPQQAATRRKRNLPGTPGKSIYPLISIMLISSIYANFT